ncbi:Hda2 protein [Saccharomycopsis crataegensis]|uniref:Hda2 protein n=1 Tax=Saccharomycopsis crataegensis TaxID=43959 RepID=A0AAV5QQN2_9ASCO|nr:Hda2 protein [Saccharomycopsis crataegensis]
MNLSNIVHNSRRSDNTYCLPAPLTSFQSDINELLVRLHSKHLLDQYGLEVTEGKKENKENTPQQSPNIQKLNDSELLSMLYTNLNLASNNPYLLVNHYIPKNMLLMNTKDSLTNVSGKFRLLDQIISKYETMNTKTTKKYNVLVLSNNSKEFDFIESLLIGRFVNYKRYSGPKLFEAKSEETVTPFNESPAKITPSSNLGTGKRQISSKDDPYLTKRLRRKHRRIMKYVKSNNREYCLTLHLITVSQLKFQFFSSEDPGTNFDFLDLNNSIAFDYIISFNNYLNLDHYHLKKMRAGYIDAKTSKYQAYSEPLPILYMLASGSIEHATIITLNWLLKNGVIKNIYKKKYIDERTTKYDLDTQDKQLLLLVLSLYLINRVNFNQPSSMEISSDSWFTLSEWLSDPSSGAQLSKLVIPPLNFPGNFDDFMNRFKSNYLESNSTGKIASPISDSLRKAIESFNLKSYNFKLSSDLKITSELIGRNQQIFSSYPQLNEQFGETTKENLIAEKQFGDSTLVDLEQSGQPAKRLKVESNRSSSKYVPIASVSALLSFDTSIPESALKNLECLATESAKFDASTRLHFYPALDKFPVDFETYNRNITSIIKNRSDSLTDLLKTFSAKTLFENEIGQFLQVRIEKNNWVSKAVFTKQLELRKEITKEEKYHERLLSEYQKFKSAEKFAIFKNQEFVKAMKGEVRDISKIYEIMGSEKLDGKESELLLQIDKEIEDSKKEKTHVENFNAKGKEEEMEKEKEPKEGDNKSEITSKIEQTISSKVQNPEEGQETQWIRYFPTISTGISYSVLEEQSRLIDQLSFEITNFESQSVEANSKIDKARAEYQNKSTSVSYQLETLGKLKARISTIEEILKRKDTIKEMKTRALEFSIGDDKDIVPNFNSNEIPASNGLKKTDDNHNMVLINEDKFNAIKYKNLVRQKNFMENYSTIMRQQSKNSRNITPVSSNNSTSNKDSSGGVSGRRRNGKRRGRG